MDFWGKGWKIKGARDDLHEVIRHGKNQGLPIIGVMNHQQILNEVNSSGARRLINVDAHSDLAGTDCDELNCGTWVSYVRWRRSSEYIWIRNQKGITWGSCNGGRRIWNKNTDWGTTKSVYLGRGFKAREIMDECVGIGISMSPAWCTEEMEKIFNEALKDYGINYKKGRRDEEKLTNFNLPLIDRP